MHNRHVRQLTHTRVSSRETLPCFGALAGCSTDNGGLHGSADQRRSAHFEQAGTQARFERIASVRGAPQFHALRRQPAAPTQALGQGSCEGCCCPLSILGTPAWSSTVKNASTRVVRPYIVIVKIIRCAALESPTKNVEFASPGSLSYAHHWWSSRPRKNTV
jgi:hypothetical protein